MMWVSADLPMEMWKDQRRREAIGEQIIAGYERPQPVAMLSRRIGRLADC
jgi:hypothetical protein